MSYKAYAGVGSRISPPDTLKMLAGVASVLDRKGYTLRSGAAEGADSAFEAGSRRKEIYLPWKGYNGSGSLLFPPSEEALRISAALHPSKRLKAAHRLLLGRNAHQVLGKDLDSPAEFLVCWTADSTMGGTAHTIRIAEYHHVPVYNLACPGDLALFQDHFLKI